MLDLRHLGDDVGHLHECAGSPPPGDDDLLGPGTVRERLDDLGDVDPAPVERIGELVKEVEVERLVVEQLLDVSPSLLGGPGGVLGGIEGAS